MIVGFARRHNVDVYCERWFFASSLKADFGQMGMLSSDSCER